MKWPWPGIKRGSSRRWTLAPTSCVTAMSVAPGRDGCLLGRSGAYGLGGALHRLDDVHVPGAPAKVAFEAPTDLVLGRVRVLRQQVGRGHDEARCAVPALQAVLVPEGLLDRVQLAILGQALDRGQALALGLDGEHRAALHRLAVDVDCAGAALACIAPDVRPGEPEVVTKVMHEQEPGLDLMLVPAAVDGSRNLVVHSVLLLPSSPPSSGRVS